MAKGGGKRPRRQQLKLGVRRVPWSEMSPEERRGWKTAIELLKQPNPWGMAAGRVLDEAAVREMGPPKQHKKRKQARRGPRPEYDIDGGITAATEAVAQRGMEEQQSDFIRRLYLELQDRSIKAPGPTWMKNHVGAFYKRLKRKTRPRGR